MAKEGHNKEVTALLARIDQLTRWERPIISPLESNPPMTLWKLMLGLIQAKLSGDCAPFLRMITALYNGMTDHEEETPAMSRSLDLLLVMSGMRDSLVDGNLPESIG